MSTDTTTTTTDKAPVTPGATTGTTTSAPADTGATTPPPATTTTTTPPVADTAPVTPPPVTPVDAAPVTPPPVTPAPAAAPAAAATATPPGSGPGGTFTEAQAALWKTKKAAQEAAAPAPAADPVVTVRDVPQTPALPEPLQSIQNRLNDYIAKMGPGVPQTNPDAVSNNQSTLLRIYHQVLLSNSLFRKQAMDLLLATIFANRTGAFADRLVFRGLDPAKMGGAANVLLFRKLTNLFVNTCDPAGRANVAKFVNRAEIIQLLTNPIEQAAILTYYSPASQASQ